MLFWLTYPLGKVCITRS